MDRSSVEEEVSVWSTLNGEVSGEDSSGAPTFREPLCGEIGDWNGLEVIV